VLVKRIYSQTDEVAASHPDIEFVKASYLNDHPLVLDTFEDRVQEILDGTGNMNCQMCKYREQVLGFEAEVGLPQESHHHHVEGIGGGLEDCPCNGDCDASCRDEDFCKAARTAVDAGAQPCEPGAAGPRCTDHCARLSRPCVTDMITAMGTATSHDHNHDHNHDHGHHHGHGHGARSSSPSLSACRPSARAALDGQEQKG
jgi:sirohydrochlorin cobaltochelatase